MRGFEPKEGVGYACNVVRQPESPRFRHGGKNCVVCTAVPVEGVKPPGDGLLGEMGAAFAEAARKRDAQKKQKA
jgi:hypothetical protein